MQYPLYYKRTRLSGPTYFMVSSPITSIEVSLYAHINGAYINKHDSFRESDLDTFIDHGEQITKEEFLEALSEALMKIKFTAHGASDAIETIKSALSKVD